MAQLNGDMVEGYDGGHRNAVFNSFRDFFTPRIIESAAEIPLVGPRVELDWCKPVRLRGIGRYDTAAADHAASAGAQRDKWGWWVERVDPFPFETLDLYLPRMARQSITVDIVDLIPRSQWYTSLAKLMVKKAWDDLVMAAWKRQFLCYECGCTAYGGVRLDGHEVWWYNAHEIAGHDADGREIMGVRRLRALRMLCSLCHETQHLGNADKRGHFKRAFERLGAINRINWGGPPDGEAAAYRKEIYDKYNSRNRRAVSWNLDLAAAAGIPLQLMRSLVHKGDGVLAKIDATGDERQVVRIVNAHIETKEGHVWVTPYLVEPRYGSVPK